MNGAFAKPFEFDEDSTVPLPETFRIFRPGKRAVFAVVDDACCLDLPVKLANEF